MGLHSTSFSQVNHLIGWVRNSFTSLAMVDYPYAASFLAPLPAFPVNVSCNLLLSEPNVLRGLALAAGEATLVHYEGAPQWVRGPTTPPSPPTASKKEKKLQKMWKNIYSAYHKESKISVNISRDAPKVCNMIQKCMLNLKM